jgi:hypothetical protein
MSGAKRTIVDRARKASQATDPETVALFVELERIPVSRRNSDNRAYIAKEEDLAWRLNLHGESRFDCQRVNDQTLLDCRPKPEEDFHLPGWERVTAMRKTLLALAGLPPDPAGLFWCRSCGHINTSDRAIRTRRCGACHELDYIRRRELVGMTEKAAS